MPTIFVTHEDPRLDYSPAYEWGESLVAIFPPGSGQVSLSPQVALANARRVIARMKRDDYLILVGDPVMIGICVAVAAEMIGRVKMLRWDKRSLRYLPIECDFIDRGESPVVRSADEAQPAKG